MSLLHSHASLFHSKSLTRSCSTGPARNPLLRTAALGGSTRSVPFPASLKPNHLRTSTKRNSSMSFNNGSMAENFSEKDEDYVDSSIVEALEVRSGPDGFVIRMRDGCLLKCIHNKSEGGKLPVYAAQPAIVLQLNDGSNLLLPIIVLELPNTMLLEAVRNVQVSRPTVYQVMSKMLDVLGYRAKLVRVTKRVNEAYYARVYLVKDGDDTQLPVSLDLRPSDAINLAVRCKIPIQVYTIFLLPSAYPLQFLWNVSRFPFYGWPTFTGFWAPICGYSYLLAGKVLGLGFGMLNLLLLCFVDYCCCWEEILDVTCTACGALCTTACCYLFIPFSFC